MDGDRVVFRLFAAGQLAVWIAFAAISHGFQYGSAHETRPFAAFYGLLAAAFLLYFATLFRFWKSEGGAIPWRAVLLWAALFRLPLVFASHPIQEIDYYRYLWDGRCLVAGVSPYAHAPADLDRLRAAGETAGEPAGKLLEILDHSPSWETIFSRIDHREVRTIYPATSQLVFAASVALLPDSAPVFARLVAWRMVLTLFDLGVVVLLIAWLRRLGVPPVRAILYGWCPLVLKEFANAAHMDAIAIFCVVAAGGLFAAGAGKPTARPGGRDWLAWLAWTAGVLAKWYPLVLAPLLLSYGWARWRWHSLLPAVMAGLLVAGVIVLPSFWKDADPGKETEGMRTFFQRWEMNDLFFSLVRENVKLPEGATGGRLDPWYSVMPDSWREGWHGVARILFEKAGVAAGTDIAFRTAQAVSAMILLVVAIRLSTRPWPSGIDGAAEWGRRAFWLLAVAWYLSATQNPWYWCWALPFAVLVRTRAVGMIAAVSALATLYYLRFWLIYRFPETAWLGLSGSRWFDEVIVWFEHGPVLVLALAAASRRFWREVGNKYRDRASHHRDDSFRK